MTALNSHSGIPSFSSEAGLSAYLREIRKFPMLSRDEEYRLAKQCGENDDVEAMHKLVTSHLRLVVNIARGYRGYGVRMLDLISEGNVGLIRAIKKFVPERGFRLATYAIWWIRAAINEYVISSKSLVRIGTVASQRKLFFNLRKLKAQMGIYNDGDLPPDLAQIIAERLSVTAEEAMEMNRRLLRSDASLNQTVGDAENHERQDFIADQSPDPEQVLGEKENRAFEKQLLNEAMEALSDRERRIIEQRRLAESPRTLDEIGQEYGISRERVRQIENSAFSKIQKQVVAGAQDKTWPRPLGMPQYAKTSNRRGNESMTIQPIH